MGRSSQKYQLDVIESVLKLFYLRFWKEFKINIEDFNGNIVPFRGFLDLIKNMEYSE
jgi:hypothetical protein